MLPQKLRSDIHQLRRVQGASSQLRTGRRVGRPPREMIMHLKDSQRADAVRRVDISRMPGQGRVQAVKDALSCHECLSGAALLSRTAVVDHGPFLPVFLQIILDRHSGGKGARAKQVMAAAVALFARGLRLRRIRFLGHGVKGVVFSQNADDGMPRSEPSQEGRLHPGQQTGHGKAFLFQKAAEQIRREILLKGGLRMLPDPVHCVKILLLFSFQRFKHLFFVHHFHPFFPAIYCGIILSSSENIFAKGAGTRKWAACRILPPYPPLRNGVCDEDCRIYAENLSGGL